MSEEETKLPDWGAAGNDSSPESKKALRVGRSRRSDAILGLGTLGILTVICGGLAIASLRGASTNTNQESVDKISDQYKALLKDPQIQKFLKGLNLGDDEAGRENRNVMLYNESITDTYLQIGDKENWQGLIKHLETGSDPDFFGQMVSLSNAKCLSPTGYINVVACEAQKPDGSFFNPGFKNLDPQTKKEYIDKYNASVDRAKKAHPSLFPSVPPKMSGVDIRQTYRRQDQRKLQISNVERRGKEQRSVRRPLT